MKCKNCDKPILNRKPTAQFCCERCQKAYSVRGERQRRNERLKMFPDLYKTFREKDNERQKKYGHKRNPETRQAWEAKNIEKVRLNRVKQTNRRKGLPNTLTLTEWKAALEYFGNKCAYCNTPLSKAYKEHFIPAASGGGLTKDNIVPSCQNCNLSKFKKNPIDWLASQVWGLIAYARIVTYLESQR